MSCDCAREPTAGHKLGCHLGLRLLPAPSIAQGLALGGMTVVFDQRTLERRAKNGPCEIPGCIVCVQERS